MGLRENLIVDWKNKHITYQDCEMFVVDQFQYEGREYLYVIDKETVLDDKADNIEVAFLYQVEGNTFANVEDEGLFQELMGEVAGRLGAEKLKEILQ